VSVIPDRRCSRADSDASIECSSCCSNKRPKRATVTPRFQISNLRWALKSPAVENSSTAEVKKVILVPALEPARQHVVGGQARGLSAITVPLLPRRCTAAQAKMSAIYEGSRGNAPRISAPIKTKMSEITSKIPGKCLSGETSSYPSLVEENPQ
jgi:hypothetical protein